MNNQIEIVDKMNSNESDAKFLDSTDIAQKSSFELLLGKGAFGKVYAIGNHAEKEMPITESVWSNEVAILKYLQHPNIISIKKVYMCTNKAGYIVVRLVMPLYSCTLADTKLCSDDNIMSICKDISSAIAHCHDHGILHRDVKEKNIVIEMDGVKIVRAILIDFGLAVLLSDKKQLNNEVITLSHRPPEIEDYNELLCNGGLIYDGRVDTWSFGIVMIWMLTSKSFYNEFDNFSESLLNGNVVKHSKYFIQRYAHCKSIKLRNIINMCLQPYNTRITMMEVRDLMGGSLVMRENVADFKHISGVLMINMETPFISKLKQFFNEQVLKIANYIINFLNLSEINDNILFACVIVVDYIYSDIPLDNSCITEIYTTFKLDMMLTYSIIFEIMRSVDNNLIEFIHHYEHFYEENDEENVF